MTIAEVITQAVQARDYFWFIQTIRFIERTDATITIHFIIHSELFVQVFPSERSNRFSMALTGRAGRLYGRDREHGQWHRHPFQQPQQHEPTPEGISPQPIMQFFAEVETILLEHELL